MKNKHAMIAMLLVIAALGRADAQSVAVLSEDAVAYRSNTAHTAQATMPDFALPAGVKWTANLSGTIEFYPVIAAGNVYVIAQQPSAPPALYDFNAKTGSVVWGPVTLPPSAFNQAALAYDDGQIFVTQNDGNNDEGLMIAYNASTGAVNWSTFCPGQWWYQDYPTALNGYVYMQEAGNVNCVRESDGTLMWTTPQLFTDFGALAVTPTGLYISGACGDTYSLSQSTGGSNWSFFTGCEGGGGYTAAYYDGDVFIQDYYTGTFPDLSAAVNANTGSLVTTFSPGGFPAFDNGYMFDIINDAVTSTNLSNWTNAWTKNDAINAPITAPTVVNGDVYVVTSTGLLNGYNESTANADVSIPLGITPSEQNSVFDLQAGDGLIVAPCGNELIAVGTVSPAAPTNLTASAGNAAVGLSWTGSTGATSYNVYRGTAAGEENSTPIGTSYTPAYTDNNVVNGTTYYYTVAAVDAGGTSGMSNETSATPVSPTPPTTTATIVNPIGGPATITLSASDPNYASNTLTTYFILDSGAQQTYSGAITVSTLGSHTISYWSVDPAGNTEATNSQTFTVVPELASITAEPKALLGDATGTVTITLTGPAPAGGITVPLTSEDRSALKVSPTAVVIPQGSTTGTAVMKGYPVTSDTLVELYARYGHSHTCHVTVLAPVVQNVQILPSKVVGGAGIQTGTVTLTSPVAVVTDIAISSDNPNAIVPSYVLVQPGHTTATFQCKTNVVTSEQTADITATGASNSASDTITIKPQTPTATD